MTNLLTRSSTRSLEPNGPLKVVIAAFPQDANPFMTLAPGNGRGVEVVTLTRDGLDLKDDLARYKPDIVIVSPMIRNFDANLISDLANNAEQPLAVVGLIEATGHWGAELAAAGAVGFYTTPVTSAIVDQFVREAPTLVDKARTSWRAPAVQTGVSSTVFAAAAAQEYRTGVVVMWSTKGGAGKTTLAVETACILALVGGKKTLLVDANMNGGHVASHLGIDQGPDKQNVVSNIMHLASDYRVNNNTMTAELLNMRTVKADGQLDTRTKVVEPRLHVLVGIPNVRFAGSPELAQEQGERFILDLLALAKEHYEFVIVDLGSSIMNGVHAGALRAADKVMFISTADKASIVDNATALDVLVSNKRNPLNKKKFHLVVNMYTEKAGVELKQIAEHMGMTVYASVQKDPTDTILYNANQGKPFSIANLDIKKNGPEVERTLRDLMKLSENLFPPLHAIIRQRDQKFDGGGWFSWWPFGKKKQK